MVVLWTGDRCGRVPAMFALSIQNCTQNWWWTASPAAH
ncbi:trp operon leader peptide [Streptomyces sp. NPDC001817]